MNLYDFDNTILDGDSSKMFISYSFIHHPFLVLFSITKSFKEVFKYFFGKSDLGLIKSELFSFIKYIDDKEEYIDKFVLKKIKYVKDFYLNSKTSKDVIISASFDFIIIPFCKHLKIKNVIATKYDVNKGRIIGKNCKSEEKVKRFYEEYKNVEVKKAFSDSKSDIPMLNLAKEAYFVKGKKIKKI